MSAPEPTKALFDIGYGVTAASEPTLEDAARSVGSAKDRLVIWIEDNVRFNRPKDEWETTVFEHASLKLALRMLEAVIPCADAVRRLVIAERKKADEQKAREDAEEKATKERQKFAIARKQREAAGT